MRNDPSTTWAHDAPATTGASRRPLYTEAERRIRDGSPWTIVQGVLAPLQFAVFLGSTGLVLHALDSGHGTVAANGSVLVKFAVLLAITVTGAVWEKRVFGRWLFAPAFFWEDVGSFVVIALHAAYAIALFTHRVSERAVLEIALLAYAAYCINAGQFVWKLRTARREALA